MLNSAPPSCDSRSPILTPAVAGILSFLAAVVISFVAVLSGEELVHSQAASPLFGDVLWPFSVGFAIVFTIVVSLFIHIITLGLIGAIETPELLGRTEYTITGLGGLVGTISAAGISAGSWVAGTDLLGGSLPTGSGESIFALAAVAIPFAYVFHQLYSPDLSPINTGYNDADTLDPEVARQRTERRSDAATANAAHQQNQSMNIPSQNTEDERQKQITKNSTAQGNADDKTHTAGNSSLDWSEMEYRWVTETDVTFDDVGGMDDLKEEIRRDVVTPLVTNPEKAEELGVSAPNTIFHGPPGTGKTFMAKAMATELGLPFAKLSGADLQSKWINESASKVKTLFEEAMTVAEQEGGAVVFLDELDSVLKSRDGGANTHEEDKKVVNEFLNHLEETGDHNIVFIGATNRLDSLDDAGIRSGRIDKKVHIGEPDTEARSLILKAQLDNRPHTISGDEIQQAAVMTEGLVAADLELVVKEAAKYVLDRDGDEIQWTDLENGFMNID
ncbi:AAA family ATPase [Natronosalvus amylolyticus]|uniref:AAA family ATPase n=1 Tax=Natronosalvus amylolyticus TaxID=2961994 RepID=UPI0020CA2583|nr:AAA family ATPase [Natronosalvus amylolyticus]